ncbi:hypothetical protein K503DRAFT_461768 [Rhizopogon vinicolor AM-OR11-026]|uniref:Uncharacterized protein n=1 Tax=Rhizopogon vinicolor AM-OR11-026 TaxID=1314800 RepID=A0A1B7MNQ9_9AGAM|nr:hypothetical protein K503DRAFT_461768 [Rhizopogon vinicolor AM-OR11-026]
MPGPMIEHHTRTSSDTLTIYCRVLPRAKPARLTGRTAEGCSQQSIISNLFPTVHPELPQYLIPYHPTQTMRFSFIVTITALITSMSVSASVCRQAAMPCGGDDCCDGLYCDHTPTVGYCVPITA